MALSPDWLRMMARYNSWQNGWMIPAADGLSDAARRLDRGAFFGSIAGTLSHVLWADQMWMGRFDGGPSPKGSGATSAALFSDWAEYQAERRTMDARIEAWANGMDAAQCAGDITWYSGLMKADVVRPKEMVFTHFFNHQTHHRGQVHAMLTAAGVSTTDTDLFYMEQM
nr:DinB family protein [Amylibacter sp.]